MKRCINNLWQTKRLDVSIVQDTFQCDMNVKFKDDCTRVVKVMQQIFIVKSPFDKIDWHKKECANQLIRSNRLKRKKAKPQTMHLKLKLCRWLRKRSLSDEDFIDDDDDVVNDDKVRVRRSVDDFSKRCVELDPLLMSVSLIKGSGEYNHDGNTIKVWFAI